MMVHDGYLVRPLAGPSKGDAPLVIDSNGVKARQSAPKRLQSVAGRNGEVAQGASLVQLDQLSHGDSRDTRKTTAAPRAEQLGGIPVRKGLNQSGRASNP